jgi:nucleoside-diphosphate-sugar epimerase
MHIGILGATSLIAKDMIIALIEEGEHDLSLFSRREKDVSEWLSNIGKISNKYQSKGYESFIDCMGFDAIINFVGVGDPEKAINISDQILEITHKFDELSLSYLKNNNKCRYIFISSGAVYGSNFKKPVDLHSKAEYPINKMRIQDWYGISKLYAEARHRAMDEYPIVDIRIFNYISRNQDINAKFLITDILRAVYRKTVLKVSSEFMVRDYIHPSDLFQLIALALKNNPFNGAIDCYSKEPIDKIRLLEMMKNKYDLKYDVQQEIGIFNATGIKPHYYSKNYAAEKIGYKPIYTSIDGIEKEFELILSRLKGPLNAGNKIYY